MRNQFISGENGNRNEGVVSSASVRAELTRLGK